MESLCKTCSNFVRIKYHESAWEKGDYNRSVKTKSGEYIGGCYFGFKVIVTQEIKTKNNTDIEENIVHVDNLIIKDCSFYNKFITKKITELKRKKNHIKSNTNDDIDDHSGGVCIKNDTGKAFL